MLLAAPTSWPAPFPWAETLVIAAAFLWGAILGSFINAVTHRLPRGESVVGGRSRCPACGATIRARDNVPILGWLLLRGRCRDCAAPIACHYPLVEAGCGLLLAGCAAADLTRGDIDRVLVRGDWMPLARFGFHAAVSLVLVTWALLASGAGRVSRVSTSVAVTLAGLAAVAAPGIQPLGVLPTGLAWPADVPRLAALATWAGGVAAAWALSGLLPPEGRPLLALLGAAVGWQVVTVVTVLMASWRLVRWAAARQGPGA